MFGGSLFAIRLAARIGLLAVLELESTRSPNFAMSRHIQWCRQVERCHGSIPSWFCDCVQGRKRRSQSTKFSRFPFSLSSSSSSSSSPFPFPFASSSSPSSHWQITKASSWLLRAYVKLENNSSKFFLSFLSFTMHSVPSFPPLHPPPPHPVTHFAILCASCTKSEWNSGTSVLILLLINPTDSRGGKAECNLGKWVRFTYYSHKKKEREKDTRKREKSNVSLSLVALAFTYVLDALSSVSYSFSLLTHEN